MRTSEKLDDTCIGTIFTVRVEGRTYRCPVSQQALYELCKSQDPQADRIDAYLELKSKVSSAVERLVKDERVAFPAVLEPDHFLL